MQHQCTLSEVRNLRENQGLRHSGKRVVRIIIGGAILFNIASVVCDADDDSSLTRPSLKGLRGFSVEARSANERSDLLEISSDQLTTDVELKLRKTGIQVLPSNRALKDGGAFLSISLTLVSPKESPDLFAFHLEMSVDQIVAPMLRPDTPGLASTWSVGSTGIVTRARVRAIRDQLSDLTDQFLNAYLAVNPRKSSQ